MLVIIREAQLRCSTALLHNRTSRNDIIAVTSPRPARESKPRSCRLGLPSSMLATAMETEPAASDVEFIKGESTFILHLELLRIELLVCCLQLTEQTGRERPATSRPRHHQPSASSGALRQRRQRRTEKPKQPRQSTRTQPPDQPKTTKQTRPTKTMERRSQPK